MKPLISILINCWNGMPFLNEAIQSVKNQTYKNWELIFWDNCSSDQSYQFVKNIKDSRIRLFRSDKHKTLYAARNDAFRKVRGEYLCILDCDDYWLPQKLQKQLEVFKNNSIQMCCTNFEIVSTKNRYFIRKPIFKKRLTISDVLNGDTIAVSSCMYKTSLLKTFSGPFYETEIIGDMHLHVKILLNEDGVILPQKLTIVRLHEKNQSVIQAKLAEQEKRKYLKWMQNQLSHEPKKVRLFKNIRIYDIIAKPQKKSIISDLWLLVHMQPGLLQIKALFRVLLKNH